MKTLIKEFFQERSDLGLHCLLKYVCPKLKFYGYTQYYQLKVLKLE